MLLIGNPSDKNGTAGAENRAKLYESGSFSAQSVYVAVATVLPFAPAGVGAYRLHPIPECVLDGLPCRTYRRDGSEPRHEPASRGAKGVFLRANHAYLAAE